MSNPSTAIAPELAIEFKNASKALQTVALKIMQYDAAKLAESEDKFLRIRAVRADHNARETLSGKSKRN